MILNSRYEPGKSKANGGDKMLPPRVGLREFGPRVRVSVSPVGRPGANLVHGHALVDTGAAITCIDQNAAERAGLTVVGSGPLSSATHSQETVPIFAGKLDVVGFGAVTLRRAYGVKLASQDMAAIIGRDLMETVQFCRHWGMHFRAGHRGGDCVRRMHRSAVAAKGALRVG